MTLVNQFADSERPETWHYGLVARWWTEFNVAQPEELAYYRAAIERFGQPALDLACGTGRLLVPLLREGLDVDGADISADMLSRARKLAAVDGLTPALYEQSMHELDLPRRYRTIYCCGSLGIGMSRAQVRQAIGRIFDHLEPGGGLVFDVDLPYAGIGPEAWARWLPKHRPAFPRPWRTDGDRRATADGDELELITRGAEFDPLLQHEILDMRARLWHDGAVIAEEEHRIRLPLYFAQEILLLLDVAGFTDVVMEAQYEARPATPDDESVVFLARRPS
ncbi:MAG TPA: methyltransferase domain-containing protein [Candidatus Binatia bacterium]|nr:methyltransferase domain-containing protein [Candidatus Binatia bacterium]